MRKEIKDYENYQADSGGYIIKPSREAKDKRNGNYTKEVRLKEHLTINGYHQIQLWKNKKVVNKLVHVLVWETFHGVSKPKDMDIDHIDGNKDNNSLDNLELVSRKENMKRAVNLRLISSINRDEDIMRCIELIKLGMSMTKASNEVGICRDTLKRIRRGEGIHSKFKKQLDSALEIQKTIPR